jgi:hypothetical protein
MQSGAHRQLDIDAPRDRNARKANASPAPTALFTKTQRCRLLRGLVGTLPLPLGFGSGSHRGVTPRPASFDEERWQRVVSSLDRGDHGSR